MTRHVFKIRLKKIFKVDKSYSKKYFFEHERVIRKYLKRIKKTRPIINKKDYINTPELTPE